MSDGIAKINKTTNYPQLTTGRFTSCSHSGDPQTLVCLIHSFKWPNVVDIRFIGRTGKQVSLHDKLKIYLRKTAPIESRNPK